MEQEDLLDLSLDFFGLARDFTEEEYRHRYLELAKKYHPDTNEFTSTVLFNELQKSKQIIDEYLRFKNGSESLPRRSPHTKDDSYGGRSRTTSVSSPNSHQMSKDPAFEIYKISKDIENRSILEYYEKTKGNPVFLNEEENPPLRELRTKLSESIRNYKKILEIYPQSLWAMDAKDSIRRLSVWVRRSEAGED